MVKGGNRTNVIPERAYAVFDCRYCELEEGPRITNGMAALRPKLPGSRLALSGKISHPPMVKTDKSRRLFAESREIARGLGLDLREGDSGGASDGSFTAALGIPTLDGLGVDGDGAHAWHEHIRVDCLAPRIALLGRLVERLGAGG